MDIDDTPDLKEPKAEKAAHEVLPDITGFTTDILYARYEELWFEDGNVIVVSHDVTFKLHAGVLKRHSSVFRDLLNEKKATQAEIYEGCQVLRLTDRVGELAELFFIMYDGGSRGFFDWRKPVDFTDLRRVTLTAVKYNVEHIIRETIARLEVPFPVIFDSTRVESSAYIGARPGYPVHCAPDDCIGAVALARAINATHPPAFIVMALYQCSQQTPEGLFEPVQYDGERVPLPRDDLVTCVSTPDRLLEASRKVKSPVLDALESPRCAAQACHASLARLVCDWVREGKLPDFAPLNACDVLFQKHAQKYPDCRLCDSCAAELMDAIDERRREVFDDLGKVFNVPGWPVQTES
ncbi:uncharacterized protein PHACADRAFT_180864 [Phanerochaete carnosa HHB-10118-sp]|uniref:BTB domain-containing protein n=1 Tax=Phanerochaete carnosa (strain HHB-10118-sp) TaxID=650164 RepID=K5VFQ4_PHACS|nr:uncharacterized protein PHACADRAFT_180864 [Phanerochaete carnosa HHB-10118-sp]EKM61831.1 hypothetical protein PHACADRAFT_180864 [Phanerochaete carnosa HHB-10118-sp]